MTTTLIANEGDAFRFYKRSAKVDEFFSSKNPALITTDTIYKKRFRSTIIKLFLRGSCTTSSNKLMPRMASIFTCSMLLIRFHRTIIFIRWPFKIPPLSCKLFYTILGTLITCIPRLSDTTVTTTIESTGTSAISSISI